jgi:hypothetical protein
MQACDYEDRSLPVAFMQYACSYLVAIKMLEFCLKHARRLLYDSSYRIHQPEGRRR